MNPIICCCCRWPNCEVLQIGCFLVSWSSSLLFLSIACCWWYPFRFFLSLFFFCKNEIVLDSGNVVWMQCFLETFDGMYMFLLVRLSGCWFHVESCWVDLLLLGDSLCTNWKYSLLFLIRFWSFFFVSILFLDSWNAAGSIRCCLEIVFYELFCFFCCCRNDLCLAMRETDCTLSIRFLEWPNTAFDYVGSLHVFTKSFFAPILDFFWLLQWSRIPLWRILLALLFCMHIKVGIVCVYTVILQPWFIRSCCQFHFRLLQQQV